MQIRTILAAVMAASTTLCAASAQTLPKEPVNTSPPTFPGEWHESATRLYLNHDLMLDWQRELGDNHPGIIGSAKVARNMDGGQVDIAVTGKDFLIRCTTPAVFHSRESTVIDARPALVVTNKTGTTRYSATRDTSLSTATLRPRATSPDLKCPGTLLLAFDEYKSKTGDNAKLVLTATKIHSAGNLDVYRPKVAATYPIIPSRPATRVVADIRPADFDSSPTIVVSDDKVTGRLASDHRTTFAQVFSVPPAQEYYLTVVMQLGKDWPNSGGKLPGLSNTGLALRSNAPTNVAGYNCAKAGWGSRVANGCRWSARTGWHGRQDDIVGFSTYYYAQLTGTFWGKSIGIPSPVPVDRWFAYVQRVRVNDVGEDNGRLSYWRCDDAGCNPVFDKSDIRFRTAPVAEALVTEVWSNVYCGGSDCGPAPIKPTEASIRRLTVTDGLPDLENLRREVESLNAAR